MNPRIQELIDQATEHDYTTWDSYNQKELVYYKFNKEKFAELIVKECVAQIEVERGNPYRNIGDGHEYGVSACDESIRRIKEHFGVEE
jgi:hypothetical protein